jgi:hypothetical protein
VAELDDPLPEAWLFTRGDASVHMEVIDRPRGLHLTVTGPGHTVASHDFATRGALLAFTRQQELELLEAGFQLQAISERRSGVDRRAASRGGAGRRRAWTR